MAKKGFLSAPEITSPEKIITVFWQMNKFLKIKKNNIATYPQQLQASGDNESCQERSMFWSKQFF